MSGSDWLDNLKGGDAVVVCRGYGYSNYKMDTVERTTATQVKTTGHTAKFNRKTGWAIGSDRVRIVEVTPEIVAKIRRAEMLDALSGKNWQALSDETLEAVMAALGLTVGV